MRNDERPSSPTLRYSFEGEKIVSLSAIKHTSAGQAISQPTSTLMKRPGRISPEAGYDDLDAEHDKNSTWLGSAKDIKLRLELGHGDRANAIPVEFADMRERLIKDFPEYFELSRALSGGKQRAATFHRLADRIWLANRQRLSRLFQRWAETYRFFDPDQGSVVHPKMELSATQYEKLQAKFGSVFYTVLDKAGFASISDQAMKEAETTRIPGGLNLLPPPPGSIETEVFYRGEVQKSMEVRNMWTLFRRREVKYKEYDRLLVTYRIWHDPDDMKEEKGCCGIKWPLLVKIRNMFALGGESMAPVPEADPQLLYMKIFKDVRSLDMDMMMPGASVEFTWLDVAFIWIPTFVGLYSAIKAVVDIWGTQTGLLDYATLIVLMVMPLSWGYKAFKETRNKENECAVQLSRIYMNQNLNNNKGVCSDILEEAQEQESNEALLAYFFLWQGGDNMGFVEKGILDRTVEDYLKGILMDYDQDPEIDFDVSDAVDKLVLMGICTRKVMPDGTTMYQAADLEEAAELINPVRVAATLNSLATVRGRGPCAMSDWKEVIAAPTRGEKVRYFCHSSGAQQYEVPESYVPHSLIASPGTVTSGIRIDQNFKSSTNRPDSASSVL